MKKDEDVKMSAADFRIFCDAFRFNPRSAGLKKATGAERYHAAELIERVADRGLIFDFMDLLDCYPCENTAEFFDVAERTLAFDPTAVEDVLISF